MTRNAEKVKKVFDEMIMESYITRRTLAKITSLSDRAVRRAIQELRGEELGYFIVSNSNRLGYDKTVDEAKIQHFVDEMEHRARAIFSTLKQARRFLKDDGSPDIFEREKVN